MAREEELDVTKRLIEIRRILNERGIDLPTGETEALRFSLSQSTGGRKMAYDNALSERLNARMKTIAQAGKLVPAESIETALRTSPGWPFDWETVVKQPAFDWRSRVTVTTPRQQLSCGCCWAFAAASVFELFVSAAYHVAVDVAEQDILNCAQGSCGGGLLHDALEHLETNGAAIEADVPYQAAEGACSVQVSRPYRINFHNFVSPDQGIPTVERMKKAIYQFAGVGTYMIATDVMLAFVGDVYDEFATGGGDHFVCVIGWDDNKPHRKGTGAWLIKNSWGTSWGNGGFAYLPYTANEIGFNAQLLSAAKPV